MDIQRKRVDKIKITHNKWLLIVIFILIVLLGIVIYFIIKNNNSNNIPVTEKECSTADDCVASSCCHANSCVAKEKAPLCDKVFCTQECSGPLDCGAGYCECVDNKCRVIVS